MTLLAKGKLFLKRTRPGIMLMIPVFLGCETVEDAGVPYELQSAANVRLAEFELPITNIRIDSLRTDNGVSRDVILVGNYTDELVGSVSAEGYFSLLYNANSSTIPGGIIADDLVYDSIRFVFSSSNLTTNGFIQSFSIYQLQDTLNNLVSLSNKRENLGDLLTTSPDFSIGDSSILSLELPKEFGEAFFNTSQSDDIFLAQLDLPSFGIIPNSASNAISEVLLSEDTTGFYLYVTDPEGIEEISDAGDTTYRDTTYVGRFELDLTPHYTHLDRNNTSGILNISEDRQTQDLPNGQTYIDPLAGISSSLTFSEIEDFFIENDPDNNPIIITNASILFEFEGGIPRDTLANFYAFLATNNDFFGSGLVVNPFKNVAMSNEAYLGGQATAAISTLGSDKDEFELDLTLFFQTLYNNYHDEDSQSELGITEPTLFVQDFFSEEFREVDGLVLLSARSVTIRRATFKENGIRLRIYYTEID